MHPTHILLVDDEIAILRGLQRMILDIGGISPAISLARDGFEAYELFSKNAFKLAIVDLSMPAMTGLELIERMSKLDNGCSFVILTGHADFGFAQEAIRLGVSRYLLKPVDEKELRGIVMQIALDSTKADASVLESAGLPGDVTIPPGSPPILGLIVNHIKSHYQDDIRLSMLSRKFNVSESHICMLFSTHMDMTFLKCVDTIRLSRATWQLVHTENSVEEIAAMTGYKYGTQLMRVCKKYTGMTPTQVREAYRK